MKRLVVVPDLLAYSSVVRCVLQMGGSDQWGNMVNGVDLGRRVEKADLFALTAPLITTSEGKKMGKSASGAVWLNADKLPEYDYWQVHMAVQDLKNEREVAKSIVSNLTLEPLAELYNR